jgi:hypothetical protein
VTEAERLKLGADRRLIFENVANGVPMDQVRSAFRRSQDEIDRELAFVARKIREARFRTRMPPLACDAHKDIRWNRRALLDTLRQLSDAYLSSELLLPRIGVQTVNTPGELREAAQHASLSVRG